ncbi:MAG: hypothetical protein AAGI68_12140 [Planctomycetota bacterium]
MPVDLHVELDKTQSRALRRYLGDIRNGTPRVLSRATKRTTDTSRVNFDRAVRQDLPVKKRDVYRRNDRRSPMQVRFVRRGGFITGGRVVVEGRRIPLGRFTARQHTRKGARGGRVPSSVSYRLSKIKGRQRVTKDLFIPNLRSGYQGVFSRVGRSRLPVDEKMGPSVGHVASKRPEVRAWLRDGARSHFEQQVRREATHLVQRARVSRAGGAR